MEVVGPNASGKTSLAVCAQAVLARDANPLGLSAADTKRSYPHDGADDARLTLASVEKARCLLVSQSRHILLAELKLRCPTRSRGAD